MVVSSEIADQMLSSTTIKNKHANLVVKSGMEEGTSILVQPEPIAIHVAIALSLVATIVNPKVDVRVEETKAIVMEK
jgi:hypothetical protein